MKYHIHGVALFQGQQLEVCAGNIEAVSEAEALQKAQAVSSVPETIPWRSVPWHKDYSAQSRLMLIGKLPQSITQLIAQGNAKIEFDPVWSEYVGLDTDGLRAFFKLPPRTVVFGLRGFFVRCTVQVPNVGQDQGLAKIDDHTLAGQLVEPHEWADEEVEPLACGLCTAQSSADTEDKWMICDDDIAFCPDCKGKARIALERALESL